MTDETLIKKTLLLIKKQTGISLELYDGFVLHHHTGRKYFDVALNHNLFDGKDYNALCRFCEKYKLIQVAPSGYKRVAIFTT